MNYTQPDIQCQSVNSFIYIHDENINFDIQRGIVEFNYQFYSEYLYEQSPLINKITSG